jgi:hypothetical protein
MPEANRIYNQIYSLPVSYSAGTYSRNSKVYLEPAPFLLNKNIDAISFQIVNDTFLSSNVLNLFDGTNNLCVENYPLFDLWDTILNSGAIATLLTNRLRLFKLKGLTSESCYFTSNSTFTTTSEVLVGNLIFYSKG